MKYTKEAWSLWKTNNELIITVDDQDGRSVIIANVHNWKGTVASESAGNAALLVHAPKTFEALTDIVTALGPGEALSDDARAALQRARALLLEINEAGNKVW